MNGIARPDDHLIKGIRNADPAQRTGERLFIYMGMSQDPLCKDFPVGRLDPPQIGIVVPSLVRMVQGDVEAPGSISAPAGFDLDDADLTGPG